MAFYDLRTIQSADTKEKFIALGLRSGAPLACLTKFVSSDKTVNLSLISQAEALKSFDSRYFREMAESTKRNNKSTLKVQVTNDRVKSIASSIEDSRLFLIRTTEMTPEQQGTIRKDLGKWFEKRGHVIEMPDRMEPTIPISVLPCYGDPNKAFDIQVRTHDLKNVEELIPKINGKSQFVANVQRDYTNLEFPTQEEARSAIKLFEGLGAVNKTHLAFSVTNYTKEHLLTKTPAKAVVAQPGLISGTRGVEVHVTQGNVNEVSRILSPVFGGFENCAMQLRGEVEPMSAVLSDLQENGILVHKPHKRTLRDIQEAKPKTVAFSDPLNFAKDRLHAECADPISDQCVESFARQPGVVLSPIQCRDISFGASRDSALFSEDAGGGKTRIAAVTAHLKTPKGKISLIIAPTSILPQWVHEIADSIPLGISPNNEAPLPPWITRNRNRTMSKSDADKQDRLETNYRKICDRFEFLPASSLRSGVVLRGGEACIPAVMDRSNAHKTQKERIDFAMARGPFDTLIVDEIHNFRSSDNAAKWIEGIRDGEIGGAEVRHIYGTSASPTHTNPEDIGQLLRLLAIRGFKTMSKEEFRKEFCEVGYVRGENGWEASSTSTPYAPSRFKEEKIPEIARTLNKMMITATLEEIDPNGFLPQRILSPIPYIAPSSRNIKLNNIEHSGSLIPISDADKGELAKEPDAIRRAIQRACIKAPISVDAAINTLKQNGPESKVIIWTAFLPSATAIEAAVIKAGMDYYKVTGIEQKSSVDGGFRDKYEAIGSFIKSDSSRILIATIGSVGEGINGLQYVCPQSIFNDNSRSAGDHTQAQGRISRLLNGKSPVFSQKEVVNQYLLLDDPEERGRYDVMMDRMHTIQFVRECNMLSEMDSESTVSVRAATSWRRLAEGRRVCRYRVRFLPLRPALHATPFPLSPPFSSPVANSWAAAGPDRPWWSSPAVG